MVPAQSEGSIAVPIKAAASETGKMTGLQSPPGIKRKSRRTFCPLAGAAAGYIDSVAVVALRRLEEPGNGLVADI